MRVAIVEDEPLMAEELAAEIGKADRSIDIVGVFGSIRDTLDYLSRNDPPDLFFSDIQLSDGLSFEIFTQLDQTIPVIFCTAFDAYALQAFKANGIDYLLKPFDNHSIRQTITKYKQLSWADSPFRLPDLTGLMKSVTQVGDRKSLIIHQGTKIFAVKYADVRVLYLRHGVPYLITKEEKKFCISSSLDKLEQHLDPTDFFRANRQVIIHRDAIAHISTYFARKLLVTLKFSFDKDIVISKANAPHFLAWLESAAL